MSDSTRYHGAWRASNHIERIDVKLVHLERFVILVADAVIIEIIADQVFRSTPAATSANRRTLVGDERKNYGFVFQTLGS